MAAIGLCTLKAKKKKKKETQPSDTKGTTCGHYVQVRDFTDKSHVSLLSVPPTVEKERRFACYMRAEERRKDGDVLLPNVELMELWPLICLSAAS